jgi:beta-lactamase class A
MIARSRMYTSFTATRHVGRLYRPCRGLSVLVVLTLTVTSCTAQMKSTDLRSEIEAVLTEYPDAHIGVSVRDASSGLSLDINGDSVFHAASTMKIAVMIELYRQAAEGRFSLNDSLEVKNEFTSIFDGSFFSVHEDSDSAIYGMLGQPMSIRDLIYRLITSSSNLATNILIELVTPDSVQATIEGLGTRHMTVLRGVEDLKAFEAGMSNTTTSADLAVLLEALRDGRAVSADASAEMLDIMFDVPDELITAGPGSRVAHKTGMITAHHHDAGIVYPAGGEPYVLTILTRGIPDEETSTRLGRDIARVVYRRLRRGITTG